MTKIINDFNSKYINGSRDIYIYLPDNYDSNHKYPVIYMQDGQNLFDGKNSLSGEGWNIERHLDKLISNGSIEPMIVAGLSSNENRLDDYSPYKYDFDPIVMKSHHLKVSNPNGDNYTKCFIEEFIPFIESNFSISKDRDKRCIGGSSMGSYISLYIALNHSEKFSKILAFSTALWFNEKEMKKFLNDKISKLKLPMHVHCYVGENETSCEEYERFPRVYSFNMYDIEDILEKNKLVQVDSFISETGIHSEKSWSFAFPYAIRDLFGESEDEDDYMD